METSTSTIKLVLVKLLGDVDMENNVVDTSVVRPRTMEAETTARAMAAKAVITETTHIEISDLDHSLFSF